MASPSSAPGAAAAPAPKKVDPDNGPAAGGTRVEIRGKNLVAVKSVEFGGAKATQVKEINPGLLEATSPKGTAGNKVDIVVKTTRKNKKERKLANAFAYV